MRTCADVAAPGSDVDSGGGKHAESGVRRANRTRRRLPALADFVGDGAFLTRWNNFIAEPASIDVDYIFEQATADATYQQVIYRDRNRGDLTGLTLLVFVGLGGVMIVIALTRRRGPAEHRLS